MKMWKKLPSELSGGPAPPHSVQLQEERQGVGGGGRTVFQRPYPVSVCLSFQKVPPHRTFDKGKVRSFLVEMVGGTGRGEWSQLA